MTEPDHASALRASKGPAWGLIGQSAAVLSLAGAVQAGTVSHAYLFSGAPGTGKATLARRLAQTLNCSQPQQEADLPAPCGACRSCRHIEEGKHPDVEVVGPGGVCDEREHDHGTDSSKDIKICQVRALGGRLSRRPFEGHVRVVTVDPADALNAYAADAFLKTLEEPPADVVLVLVSAREEVLPETVRSRLRRIEVRAAPGQELTDALEQRGASMETATLLARLSRGSAGRAIDMLAQPDVLSERQRLLDELIAAGAAPRYERFAFAAELATRWSRDRKAVQAVLNAWIDWWRDVVLAAAGSERGILNVDRIEQIHAAAAETEMAGAVRAVQALRDVQGQLEENANARLALEVLMLRLPEARAVRT